MPLTSLALSPPARESPNRKGGIGAENTVGCGKCPGESGRITALGCSPTRPLHSPPRASLDRPPSQSPLLPSGTYSESLRQHSGHPVCQPLLSARDSGYSISISPKPYEPGPAIIFICQIKETKARGAEQLARAESWQVAEPQR